MATNNNIDVPNFSDQDVLAFRDGTVKFVRFRQALDIALSSKVPDALADSLSTQKMHFSSERRFRYSRAWAPGDRTWFQDGVDCEILQLGAPQWQTGKVRLRLVVEFVPDEAPEALPVTPDENPFEFELDYGLDDGAARGLTNGNSSRYINL